MSKISSQLERLPSNVVRDLPIGDLREAPWNARKTFDPRSTAELADSIREHGIQVPLIVRFLPHSEWMSLSDAEVLEKSSATLFQVVAGHRRMAASIAAGLKQLPCIVRELTDDQAREIGLVDNLQREDVPALEEADAYAELQKRLGTSAAIASRVGKDVAYVARRLQLVSLAQMPRKALAERLITIDHALLLARLGEDEQDVNLKWALNVNAGPKTPLEDVMQERMKDRDRKDRWSGYWEPQSVLDLKHHIERNVGRKLSRAPWSLDDATLAGALACNACPSNTKHNDTLFGDMNIAAATCENGGCFEEKRAAFVQIQLAKIPEVHDLPDEPTRCLRGLKLSWKATTVKPRIQTKGLPSDRDHFAPEQTFRHGQWIEAKPKSCKFARQGVTVDWSDAAGNGWMGSGGEKLRKPGQILLVCISEACKVHRKGYEKSKSSDGGAKADEDKREKMHQAAIAESKIRSNVAFKAIEAIKSIPAEALRHLVSGQVPNWGEEEKAANALMPGLKKIIETAKVDSVEFAKALAVVSISHLVENFGDGGEYSRKKFLASIKRLGYDGAHAWKVAAPKAEKALKSPKKSILSPAAKKRVADAQRKRRTAAKKGRGRK